MNDAMVDAIIIGKGPAGISAALYTIRSNIKTLIIGLNNSALKKAEKIENYFGFSNIIRGEKLLEEGERQVARLGAEMVEDEVIDIDMDKEGCFLVKCAAGAEYRAKTVLIATGQSQKKINLQNLANFEGKGVSYCVTCDGFFYKNLKVGVLGFKDFAIHEAIELETYSKDITIFTNGMDLDVTKNFKKESERFKINKTPILELQGEQFLENIKFINGTSELLDGLFIAYDSATSIDFARKLGVIVNENSVVVDKNQQTNLEGLFAAGDCTGGFKQVSVAVGQGAIAGKRMAEYVRGKK